MKYCSHCGKELMDEAVVCTGCGCAVANISNITDEPSIVLNVLSFFLPVVGLILFIVIAFYEKTPMKAKAIGKWALIGFVVNLVLILFA